MRSSRPLTDPATSSRMSRQRRRDTAPEVELRRLLHAAGYRYRVNYKVPGLARRTIDIAFTSAKLAVFLDGCFWHACPEHATWPRSNAAWWKAKLDANVARDRQTDDALQAEGWKIIRIWEHEPLQDAAVKVIEELGRRVDRT